MPPRSRAAPAPRRHIPRVVLLIESSRASGRGLLRGIADYARDHTPWSFYWEPGGLEKAWPQLKTLDADGIILRDVEKLDDVLAYGIPAVVVGHSRKEVPGLANVLTDSSSIAAMAADHLIRCGFRHFAFCGLEDAPWSRLRGEAFQAHLDGHGRPTHFYPSPAASAAAGWRAERRTMAEWLASLPKPVGIMTANDDRGEQVIEACKTAALVVPDQVGVIGVDNDELVCDLSDPPMSSVALNFVRAGYESAQVLDRLMQGRRMNAPTIPVPATHVVCRRSTDIVAVHDPQLARALRFIRDHARETISVPGVARAAGLSRRVLEKRFRRTLRRSALAEIRRSRVEEICRMLIETNQSIGQIALAHGFEGPEHIARYFRQEKKMTPLAFRRAHGGR